jgi:hypothetical protein
VEFANGIRNGDKSESLEIVAFADLAGKLGVAMILLWQILYGRQRWR